VNGAQSRDCGAVQRGKPHIIIAQCYRSLPQIAPSRPFALLTSVSAALPTIPLSSVGVNVGAEADEGVITAVLGDDLFLGDGGAFLLVAEFDGDVVEVKRLPRPSTGEFDGVGLVDLNSSKVPVSFSSASESPLVSGNPWAASCAWAALTFRISSSNRESRASMLIAPPVGL